MFTLAAAILDMDIVSIVEVDNAMFSTGDVIATYSLGDDERMPWRIVAGEFVGEYGLQYRFSKGSSKSAITGAIREGGDVWRWFTGNDDISHRRFFRGLRNAKAACKRHYERNN